MRISNDLNLDGNEIKNGRFEVLPDFPTVPLMGQTFIHQPSASAPGSMYYWNGVEWVIIGADPTSLFYRTGIATPGTGSVDVTIPMDVVPGDLMFMLSTYKLLASVGTVSIAQEHGWTAMGSPVESQGNAVTSILFTREVEEGDAGRVVPLLAPPPPEGFGYQQHYVLLFVYAGAELAEWELLPRGAEASTIVPVPELPTEPGDLVLLLGAVRGATNGATTFTTPAGFAMRHTLTATSASSQGAANFIAEGSVWGDHTLIASRPVWAMTGQIILRPKGGLGDVLSVNNRTGHVTVTRGDLDIENVDNTRDVDKIVSTATQAAIDAAVAVALALADSKVKKFAMNLPAMAQDTSYVVPHNLNSYDIIASFQEGVHKKVARIDYAPTTANSLTVTTNIAIAADTVRIIVMA